MLSDRRLRPAAAAAVVACSAYAAGLVLLRHETFWLRAFDDIGMLLSALAAAVACGFAARRESGRGALTLWLWSGQAAVFVLGQIVWTWIQLSGRRDVPFPSLADAFYLCGIPLLAAAVFMIAGFANDWWQRLSAVVEGALAAGSLLFMAWVLFLGEAVRSQVDSSALAQGISLAYPLGTGAGAAALIVVVARRGRRVDPRLMLATAFVVWMTAVRVLYAWYSATGRYTTGVLFDVGWPIGFSLLALAAVAPGRVATAPLRTARATFAREGSPFLLTFAALTVAVVHYARGWLFSPFELWTGLVVLLLMLMRQALAMWDNLTLNRSLEEKVLRRTVELRASRERYRSVIDSIAEIIFIVDDRGRVTFVNNAWASVTGIELDEVIGAPMMMMLHPDDRAIASSRGHLLLTSGDHDPIEIRLLAADGGTRWVDVRARAQRGADGEVTGYSGVMVDVTARRLAEASVRESEERWRLLLESSGEGIYGVDGNGICTFVNAAASAMLGYQPGALLGRNIHQAVHHSRLDGTPYPASECAISASFRQGVSSRVDGEWWWRADRAAFPVEYSSQPIRKDGVVTGAVVTFTDITARRAAQEEIRHRSLHDGLTGLPNRTSVTEQLEATVRAGAAAASECSSALLIMDLDRFKDINDTFGHPVGDVVLQEVARRMTGPGLLRGADIVGRLGGDEFAVVLTGLSSPDEAVRVAEKIVAAVSQPIHVDRHEFQVGCSIGIALAPVHGTEPTVLLQRADIAMYVAKGADQSVSVYTPEADIARMARLELIDQLRSGIEGDQLVLHYQPIIDLRTGRLARLEALVRWNHPTQGLLWPDSFVPLAEQAGAIMTLTTWALRDALRQSRLWCSEGIVVPIAVNISAQTLHDPRLQAAVEEWYAGPTPPGPLELEITESAVLSDPDGAVVVLSRLVALGARIAIDDFGTGYSSLAQLKRLPVHSVKVDKSFVAEMHTDRRDASIVQTVIQLSHTLGLEVVAEGVETQQSAEHLARLGCDYAQGWYFGKPQPAADITAVLLEGAELAIDGEFGSL